MALVRNPKVLKWTPPTTRVNGEPITVPLNFEVGYRTDPAAEFQPLYVAVGTLQDNGNYQAPIEAANLPQTGNVYVALRAIDNQQDDVADNDLFSVWSNEVEISFEEDSEPEAPLDFSAE